MLHFCKYKMTTKILSFLLAITVIGLLSACGGGEKKQNSQSGEKAILKFQETQFNFGAVKNGDTVRHVYKFKNEGNAPLIIKDAKVACDCTIPTWSKDPIAPGAESEIKVEFRSKDKIGTARKEIKIYANTDPEVQSIFLIGEVNP